MYLLRRKNYIKSSYYDIFIYEVINMEENIRKPKQQRAIKTKEKIIKSGFELICKKGYYNTNTAEIAKEAGVSTGIVYQYFKDKYDIFIYGLKKYGENVFFPILNDNGIVLNKDNFEKWIRQIIDYYIKNHKISNIAHEEIISMVHSDKNVAKYYYKREIEATKSVKQILINNGFKDDKLCEKVHLMLGIIDNLSHEIIYHKHDNMDYVFMTELTINIINNLFKNSIPNL